jgi:hypothetical protein
MFPAVAVMQDDQPAEVAGDFLVDAIDRLELVPDAADRVGERRVDAVVIVTANVALGINAIAGDDDSPRAVSRIMNC